MENQIHADELGTISVSTTVASFDLMVYSATEMEAPNKPKLVHQQRVVMPIDGFLRAAAHIQAVLRDMEKKGVIAPVLKTVAKNRPAKK